MGARKLAALAAVLVAALLTLRGGAAYACPFDDDCDYTPVGPIGPVAPDGDSWVEVRADAWKAPGDTVWTYIDGTTTEEYDPTNIKPLEVTPQLIWDVVIRTIETIFTPTNKYDLDIYDYGAPRG